MIVVHRHAVVKALQPLITSAYEHITNGDRIAEIEYRGHFRGRRTPLAADGDVVEDGASSTSADADTGLRVVAGRIEGNAEQEVAELSASYLECLRSIRNEELRRGINLEGAHRDDLAITLDGLPVRGFASHGEVWSSALMLRLAELELLRLDGDYPVLILDDVFAELDATRRRGLLSQMGKVEQILVTAAVEEDVPPELEAQVIRVFRGEDGSSQVRMAGDE